MTSKLTRERIEWLNYAATGLAANGTEMAMSPQDVIALTEHCLAAMASEPVAYWRKAFRADGFCYADGINSKRYHDENPQLPLRDGDYWEVIPLYRHAQPAPEITATVERLNASGYEYEGGEVTPQNVAAVVDILLQQLDDAVQGRNAQPAPVVVPEGLNPETTDLVLRFASALADKLYKAEQKYGRSTDWMKDDWYDDCLQSLWEHIEKGDPRDVAAYCAFMWYHGWVTTDYDRNVQNACRAAMLNGGKS